MLRVQTWNSEAGFLLRVLACFFLGDKLVGLHGPEPWHGYHVWIFGSAGPPGLLSNNTDTVPSFITYPIHQMWDSITKKPQY